MMQYKEVTDYEINKTVAKYLKLNTIAHDRTEIVLFDDMDATPFDPCNSPADAMPIIIENRISLIKEDDHYIAASTDVGVEGYIGSPELMLYGLGWLSKDKNLYRAAMEVFLMMKDAENEK